MAESSRAVSPTRATFDAFAERLWLLCLFFIPLLVDLLAQAPYFGFQTRLYPATLQAATIVAAFFILLLYVTPSPKILETFSGAWQRRALMVFCFLCALMTFPFMGGTLSFPLRIVFGIFAALFLVLVIRNPASLFWFFLLAVAYSFLQRTRFLNAVEIRTEFSDILPLIEQAGKNFLAGNDPYIFYSLPLNLPLVYLPITWASYVPTLAAQIDIRFTNLAAEFGIVLIFLSLVYKWRHLPAANLAFGYAAFLLVLPTAMFWDSFTAHPIWWFWLLLSVRLLIARRFGLWAIAMGVTLATSQLALVVLPVFGIFVLRDIGLPRALLYFAILVGVALLIVAPFAYRNPFDFLNDTLLYYADLKNYGKILWEYDQRWQYILGFGGEAWRRGFPDALRWVQGALIVILAALYAFRFRNTTTNVLRVATVTLGFFLLFSAVVWQYYFQAVFYLLLFFVSMVVIPQERRTGDVEYRT